MSGFRKCDEKTCELPATHWMVWTQPQVYCLIHLQAMLNVANAISYPTPATTVRKLTVGEMIVEEGDSGNEEAGC